MQRRGSGAGREILTLVMGLILVPPGRQAQAADSPEWRVDRRVELASVLCRLAGYEHDRQLTVHEFCHPFVNPWVDAHSGDLRPEAEKLLAVSAATMKAEAYTSWQVMVYESLVCAATSAGGAA